MGLQLTYLPAPVTDKETEDGGSLEPSSSRYGLCSMQGWRRNQEDAHVALPNFDKDIGLYAVFDGHGGRGVARFAAKTLPDLIKSSKAYAVGDYKSALEEAFLAVDEKLRLPEGRREVEDLDKRSAAEPVRPIAVPRRVLQRMLKDQGTTSAGALEVSLSIAAVEDDANVAAEDMALIDPARVTLDPTPEAQGCTAVAVLLIYQEDAASRIFCANAGDSRAILGAEGGRLVELSEDQKPQNPSELARIEKAGGFVKTTRQGDHIDARVQGDLNMSRALGDLRYKLPANLPPEEQILSAFPEVRQFPPTSQAEFIVIGCDGIWERSTSQAMIDWVRARLAREEGTPQLSRICSDTCDKGLCPAMDESCDGSGCDNMTMIIVQLKDLSKHRGSAPEGQPDLLGTEEQALKKRRTDLDLVTDSVPASVD